MARPKYPHMLPIEVEIWDRFAREHAEEWDRFDYDVHVGSIPELPADTPEHTLRLAEAVMRKRIDAVGWRGNQPYLFEVKPRAGMSALGQLLTYRTLFRRDVQRDPEPFLRVVTDSLAPDMKEIFNENDVAVYVV